MSTTTITRRIAAPVLAIGVAAGGALTLPGTAHAAAPDTSVSAVQTVAEVQARAGWHNNLGVPKNYAGTLQNHFLKCYGYHGRIDGELGHESWKAFQRYLKKYYHYSGSIDGVIGPRTITALQRMMNSYGFHAGSVDGIAGKKTRAALKAYAVWLYNKHVWYC